MNRGSGLWSCTGSRLSSRVSRFGSIILTAALIQELADQIFQNHG